MKNCDSGLNLTPMTVDLALAGGVYSVTIRSDAGMEILSFEADTGEVIA